MKLLLLFLAPILVFSCLSKKHSNKWPIIEGKWVNCNNLDEEVEISQTDKNLLIKWDNQNFYLERKTDSLYVGNNGTITLVWKTFQPLNINNAPWAKNISNAPWFKFPKNLDEWRAYREKEIKERTRPGLYDSLSKNENWKYTITSGKWTLSGLETDSRGSFELCDWQLYSR
jgi:hypothetical protein